MHGVGSCRVGEVMTLPIEINTKCEQMVSLAQDKFENISLLMRMMVCKLY